MSAADNELPKDGLKTEQSEGKESKRQLEEGDVITDGAMLLTAKTSHGCFYLQKKDGFTHEANMLKSWRECLTNPEKWTYSDTGEPVWGNT